MKTKEQIATDIVNYFMHKGAIISMADYTYVLASLAPIAEEMPEKEKCPHLSCLVNHNGNPCTCNMKPYCNICKSDESEKKEENLEADRLRYFAMMKKEDLCRHGKPINEVVCEYCHPCIHPSTVDCPSGKCKKEERCTKCNGVGHLNNSYDGNYTCPHCNGTGKEPRKEEKSCNHSFGTRDWGVVCLLCGFSIDNRTTQLEAKLSHYKKSMQKVADAWDIKGVFPNLHEVEQQRLKVKWPTLFNAIQSVRTALAENECIENSETPIHSDKEPRKEECDHSNKIICNDGKYRCKCEAGVGQFREEREEIDAKLSRYKTALIELRDMFTSADIRSSGARSVIDTALAEPSDSTTCTCIAWPYDPRDPECPVHGKGTI